MRSIQQPEILDLSGESKILGFNFWVYLKV